MTVLLAKERNENFNDIDVALQRLLEINKTKSVITCNNVPLFHIDDKQNLRINLWTPTKSAMKQLFSRLKTKLSVDYLEEINNNPQLYLDNLSHVGLRMQNRTLKFLCEDDILRAIVSTRYTTYSHWEMLNAIQQVDFKIGNNNITLRDDNITAEMFAPYKWSASDHIGVIARNSESGRGSVMIANYICVNANTSGTAIMPFPLIVNRAETSNRCRHIGDFNILSQKVQTLMQQAITNIDTIKTAWSTLGNIQIDKYRLHKIFQSIGRIIGLKLISKVCHITSGELLLDKNHNPTVDSMNMMELIYSVMTSVFHKIETEDVKNKLSIYLGNYV